MGSEWLSKLACALGETWVQLDTSLHWVMRSGLIQICAKIDLVSHLNKFGPRLKVESPFSFAFSLLSLVLPYLRFLNSQQPLGVIC